MRLLAARLLAAAVAIGVAAGTKLALDAAIAPHPWFVVTFIAVLLATVAGGAYAGLLAGLGILVLELRGPGGLDAGTIELIRAGPAVEFVSALLAVVTGEGLRVTRDRARRNFATAQQATRASVDLERRWSVLTIAIAEFATLGTPLQVEEALVRHATALAGREIRFDRTAGGTGDPTAQVAVPVVGAAGQIGALRPARSAGTGRDLPDEDRMGLAALGTLAATALDRVRLRSTSDTSIVSAERSGQRLERLQTLTTELAALVAPEPIGEVVLGHVLEMLGAPVGLFYLKDAAGDFRLAHARGYPIGLAGHDARLSPGDQLPAADALRHARPVVVASPAEWRERYPGASDRLAITGTRSVIAWPIGSPPSALLVVHRAVEGTASADELAQLEAAGHQAMQAIERARIYAREREARQLQEAFLGVMSHELRTPITTILAGSTLLARDQGMATRSRELAADIEAEADRLFRLVEDLLVLSRLERGSLSVGDEPVHLVRVLERVAGSEAARWPETRFELPPEPASHLVRGDETYVEQVVRNLLTNAAKYSPPGSRVVIVLERRGEEIAVRVLDEGAGVTEAEAERLFGLFYRSPTTAASAAGAGIGLFVCRRLVAAMGGRIWARPRPEGGSEFGFSLSRYPDDDPPPEPPATEPATGSAEVVSKPADGMRLAAAGIARTVDNGSPTGGDGR